MTVKKLMKVLSKMPPDVEVICDRYSDYQVLEEPTLIEVLDIGGVHPYIRYYPHQHPERPINVVKVCHFEGN